MSVTATPPVVPISPVISFCEIPIPVMLVAVAFLFNFIVNPSPDTDKICVFAAIPAVPLIQSHFLSRPTPDDAIVIMSDVALQVPNVVSVVTLAL